MKNAEQANPGAEMLAALGYGQVFFDAHGNAAYDAGAKTLESHFLVGAPDMGTLSFAYRLGNYGLDWDTGDTGTLIEQAAARGKPLATLVIDIDYFKAINDSHGHDAGDDVLRDFALRIKRSIRGIDLACRYGGEEFVIVMPETDMAVAAMVAERLRRRIAAEPFAIAQGTRAIPVTISIGIAGLRGGDDTAANLLKRADQALYRAKRDGRNRVVPDAA